MDVLLIVISGICLLLLLFVLIKIGRNQQHKSEEQSAYINHLKSSLDKVTQDFNIQQDKASELSRNLALKTQENEQLQLQLKQQKEDLSNFQEKFKNDFKLLSQQMLEEKGKKFSQLNQDQLGQILNPLKEKISDFEKQVGDLMKQEGLNKAKLETEIKNILALNQQLSNDAKRLTDALRGDSKAQGDWGEMQLETLLNYAGLQNEVHYSKQDSHKTENGRLQTDFLIKLPGNKTIILDAKVSLTAYERYYHAESSEEQQVALRDHVRSVKTHIDTLGSKEYQRIESIKSPDYVIMFVPLEAAFHVALQAQPELFEQAMKKNVVLVSTSTLLATLRTINFLWSQENQQKNAKEIAKQAGMLFDKFLGFKEDLEKIGSKLDDANASYRSAFNKLSESKKQGDTIIGRIQKLKELGADTTKTLEA